ncbi:MAG: pantothenate kinase [Sulfurimonas sp.]|nr:MAG: pantothenate kinase [Sulfurimonas sp.]
MLLCDIGNTSYHFLKDDFDYKEDVKVFNPSDVKGLVYYICVNTEIKKILLKLNNWIDISKKIDKTAYYETMGIDRIIICESIQDGVIIDAGSAVTVDIVNNGVFEGGFIYPGIKAMSDTYKNISSALNYEFNFDLNLESLPKNSRDSISYAYLKLIYTEVISLNKAIYLTGGDSLKFSKIFKNAKIDKNLIFRAMLKYI